MTILAPKILNLKDSDRLELQQLINKHNTPQQIALRAKIIVMISQIKPIIFIHCYMIFSQKKR
ncbi:hypothetical protein PN471_20505 [Aphanizomenon sp. CS-733/32]|uniref:hypothetical protein n=1 Tax=Aphanizomenon sp. CS-733/32 TaxID=3021715 RepID=UPI00232F43BE|nr:hypothetical protein [Aphanizomenon sp. CS-733/32]MDB9310964.1 hypothetical protein [Aphanizomenon sp. CS-733/32]